MQRKSFSAIGIYASGELSESKMYQVLYKIAARGYT